MYCIGARSAASASSAAGCSQSVGEGTRRLFALSLRFNQRGSFRSPCSESKQSHIPSQTCHICSIPSADRTVCASRRTSTRLPQDSWPGRPPTPHSSIRGTSRSLFRAFSIHLQTTSTLSSRRASAELCCPNTTRRSQLQEEVQHQVATICRTTKNAFSGDMLETAEMFCPTAADSFLLDSMLWDSPGSASTTQGNLMGEKESNHDVGENHVETMTSTVDLFHSSLQQVDRPSAKEDPSASTEPFLGFPWSLLSQGGPDEESSSPGGLMTPSSLAAAVESLTAISKPATGPLSNSTVSCEAAMGVDVIPTDEANVSDPSSCKDDKDSQRNKQPQRKSASSRSPPVIRFSAPRLASNLSEDHSKPSASAPQQRGRQRSSTTSSAYNQQQRSQQLGSSGERPINPRSNSNPRPPTSDAPASQLKRKLVSSNIKGSRSLKSARSDSACQASNPRPRPQLSSKAASAMGDPARQQASTGRPAAFPPGVAWPGSHMPHTSPWNEIKSTNGPPSDSGAAAAGPRTFGGIPVSWTVRAPWGASYLWPQYGAPSHASPQPHPNSTGGVPGSMPAWPYSWSAPERGSMAPPHLPPHFLASHPAPPFAFYPPGTSGPSGMDMGGPFGAYSSVPTSHPGMMPPHGAPHGFPYHPWAIPPVAPGSAASDDAKAVSSVSPPSSQGHLTEQSHSNEGRPQVPSLAVEKMDQSRASDTFDSPDSSTAKLPKKSRTRSSFSTHEDCAPAPQGVTRPPPATSTAGQRKSKTAVTNEVRFFEDAQSDTTAAEKVEPSLPVERTSPSESQTKDSASASAPSKTNKDAAKAPSRASGAAKEVDRKKRRRQSHNQVERRRRDTINEFIAELATLLPEAMLMDAIAGSQNGGNASKVVKIALLGHDGQGNSGDDIDAALGAKAAEARPNKGVILKKSVEYVRALKEMCEHQATHSQMLQSELSRLRTHGSSSEHSTAASVPPSSQGNGTPFGSHPLPPPGMVPPPVGDASALHGHGREAAQAHEFWSWLQASQHQHWALAASMGHPVHTTGQHEEPDLAVSSMSCLDEEEEEEEEEEEDEDEDEEDQEGSNDDTVDARDAGTVGNEDGENDDHI